MAKRPTKRELWHPVDSYDEQDIRSIQTLARYAMGAEIEWPVGQEPPVPTPMDVKRALDCIVYKLAQTYEEQFTQGQPDAVAYLLGRRSVGLAIVKLMRLKVAAFAGK
jgi:hypothetical protein